VESLRELKHHISFLNLLNGLHVTEKQFGQLIEINTELKDFTDGNKEKFGKLMEDEKAVLVELEKVLRANKPIPKRLKQKVHTAEGRSKKARRMIDEATVKYSKRVESIFTDEQKDVIADFEPCSIPPKNLSDPVRVGQASDSERVMSLLRRLRQLPEHIFEANLDRIADRQIQHLTGKKRLTDEEKKEECARLKEFLRKVRSLDNVEFEMCKEELAGEYKWKDRAKELQKELREINRVRHPKRNRGKASWYFLDAKIIPVLKERLAKVRGGKSGLKGGSKPKHRRK
jgi:hypothetical protein